MTSVNRSVMYVDVLKLVAFTVGSCVEVTVLVALPVCEVVMYGVKGFSRVILENSCFSAPGNHTSVIRMY